MNTADKLKGAIKQAIPGSMHLYADQYWSAVTWPLYSGNAVRCPICNGSFRKFLPHFEIRHGARCPRCRSYERHRLLWLYLKKRTNLFRENLRLLHVAPEYLLQRKFRTMRNLEYTSADLFSPIAMVRMDIRNMLFRDKWFDAILCYHVLEHIDEDRKAMAELFRVLKPGGWAIIQVPMADTPGTYEDPTITDPKEREKHFGQDDHVRQYGRDFKDRLEAAGFHVQVDPFVRNLAPSVVARFGLSQDEDIYYCTRSAN